MNMNHYIGDHRLLLSPNGGDGGGAASSARFAMIGDYGEQNGDFHNEMGVPAFVNGWKPDFIVSLGDNAYSNHDANPFKKTCSSTTAAISNRPRMIRTARRRVSIRCWETTITT